MSKESIVAVLGLLRRFKTTESLSTGNAPLHFLQAWAGDHSSFVVLRLALASMEHVENARLAITQSELSQEAKDGLIATLTGLSQTFSFENFGSAVQNFLPALDSSITNFAIIASMADAQFSEAARAEVSTLVGEIDGLAAEIRASNLDVRLRDIIVRHLGILAAMLRNADAVGVEPALSAYFDLMWHLRGAANEDKASADQSASGFWEKMKSWGDRLTTLANMADSGTKLLPYAEKVPDLLRLFQG